MVFDSMGKITNAEDLWNMRLEEVKKYIDDNGKRPSSESLNKDINMLSKWLSHQITNFNKKQKNMKDEKIYNKWNEFINSDKYKKYFILPSIEQYFNMNLNKVINYIDKNNKRPSEGKNKNVSILGKWIQHQITNYNNKQENMKNELIYKKWTEFINNEKYKQYFQSQYEDFIMNLNKLKIYIDENNKRPSRDDKNKEIKFLGEWIHSQITNFNKKECNMKDEKIYNTWTEFINSDKYKIYFQSQYERFIMNLIKVKTYIDKNNKRPSQTDKDEIIKTLGIWISNQLKNYNKKTENMKDENIYNNFTEFKNDEKYKKYFK